MFGLIIISNMKVTMVEKKTRSIEEYLSNIRPYLKNIIIKSDTWKPQLTIAINFISFKGNDEERAMHSKSDNKEIMINDKADGFIEERFESLPCRYQIGNIIGKIVVKSLIVFIYCT